ncbi:non-homologous end-joining DNA ligase [Bacillus tamaricis]|uniref:Non-homologous end-joining DNA ligase n=2 Tax=Evansella tamaricis TaxID=2069301 RepID=A0ABS6JKF6_9BACI|nr:non-homologous end-joining DNA ligase [Evansella tamaricis]
MKKRNSNYKGTFFITGLRIDTEEFEIGILRNNLAVTFGVVSEGFKVEEKHALIQSLLKKLSDEKQKGKVINVSPGICMRINFKGLDGDQLVQPVFSEFRLKEHWENCTWGNLLLDNASLEDEVYITNPSKPLWHTLPLNKDAYISYLYEIAPVILPFLHDRLLTVIRYPHGVDGESFYQKSCPDYAPAFIQSQVTENINYILCNNLSTLLWLGNQLALEFHVPFETTKSKNPMEIVFDLDPPSKDHFPLAVKAALEMQKLFTKFEIKSYPKLSGNKGLQIHIPVMDRSFSYLDSRVFTEFIARYLVEKFPKDFTIERMKKNRGEKLYIDYLQHWEGKTIICPYSARGKELPTIAAPLLWEEINENLDPALYTIPYVKERVEEMGCPFLDNGYFSEENISLKSIIATLQKS